MAPGILVRHDQIRNSRRSSPHVYIDTTAAEALDEPSSERYDGLGPDDVAGTPPVVWREEMSRISLFALKSGGAS